MPEKTGAPDRVPVPAGDAFASGVDSGSDVDGDGVHDMLVFDAGQRGKRPGVWLMSGKNGSVLRALPGHPGTIMRDARFVGDVDGDRLSDLVITMETADGTTNWFAVSAATGKMLWKKSRGPKDTCLVPIGWVGDVDGDGCRDQVCRELEPIRRRGGPNTLRILSGKTGEPGATFEAQLSGQTISDAGDVDADGFADIAALTMTDGHRVVGVYSCHLSRWLWSASGGPRETRFGLGLAGGRDCNGDGVPDVLVSSPSEGVQIIDALVVRDPDQVHVLSGKDGKTIDTREVPASAEPSSFGESLCFVDDADKDGKPEILLGDGEDGLLGSAWLFSSHDRVTRGFVGPMDGWHFGRHVLATGDLDGDGVGDFCITQTPRHHGQEGAVVACSGATLKMLWKTTRKDVDVEPTPSKPVERPSPASDAVEEPAATAPSHEPESTGTPPSAPEENGPKNS